MHKWITELHMFTISERRLTIHKLVCHPLLVQLAVLFLSLPTELW